ncbi:MAG: YceI family protein [Janthinobacterium lividum]
MKQIFLMLFLAPFFWQMAAAQTGQKVTSSAVTFRIKNMGIGTEGKFGGFKATISFDQNNLDKSSIEASVDTRTLDSDNSMRDNHLKKEEYFDVEKYPEITLKSVSFTHQKNENYLGQFDVTIKDKTKRVKVPFTYTESGSSNSFKGSFTISRSDFGIGGKSMVLADDALVSVAVETTK